MQRRREIERKTCVATVFWWFCRDSVQRRRENRLNTCVANSLHRLWRNSVQRRKEIERGTCVATVFWWFCRDSVQRRRENRRKGCVECGYIYKKSPQGGCGDWMYVSKVLLCSYLDVVEVPSVLASCSVLNRWVCVCRTDSEDSLCCSTVELESNVLPSKLAEVSLSWLC